MITPPSEARVPVMDRGFLYGDSIYEVFRTYDGVPLFYDEHWHRLENSAALIHMAIGFSRAEVHRQIRAAIHASGAPALKRDAFVRFIITRGDGELDLLPSASARNRLVVIVKGRSGGRSSTRSASASRSSARGATPAMRSIQTSRAGII
jgi:branched-chain amino acid aminotransferase